ncbi:MAG: FtsX-like permease family protein [Planctomycetes bacterium]|nr:FtsX-like permease family protein [Planctomycetota bacterium]
MVIKRSGLVHALIRLLLSDLSRLWKQGIAIIALIAVGVATFIMSTNTMTALEESRDRYYLNYRFADLFTPLVRAPQSLAASLSEIDGVDSLQTRIVKEVLFDMPDVVEPVSGRLVSLDDHPRESMNGICLRRGRYPEYSDRTEVLVSELFAEAHRIEPGDRLVANFVGIVQELEVVGIALSPEFVYVVQPGLLLSDDKRYGVLWVPYASMAHAFNLEGAFNNLTVRLTSDANKQHVVDRIDQLTLPYGGSGTFDRSEQESNRRVSDELSEVRTMAYLAPSIFLSVSAFLFNIIVSRLVYRQREQIATLRAFGYYPSEIGWHYARMVLVWVVLGTAIGIGGGIYAARGIFRLYMMFFRFPQFIQPTITWEWGVAFGLTIGVAAIGTYRSTRRAMEFPLAVAMRPEAPQRFDHPWMEKLEMTALMTPAVRMIIRRLEANFVISLLSILGVAFGLAILVLSSFMEDTIEFVIDNQFVQSQRHDLMITFRETASESALHDVEQLPGVTYAEPFCAVPVRMRSGLSSERLSLMGLCEHPALYRVPDERTSEIEFDRRGGLTITQKLAELLHVRPGNLVEVDILEGDRQTVFLPIARMFPNYTGPAAYMERSALHDLLEEGERISGTFVALDSSQKRDT